MATICLSKEACASNGITLGEALLLLAIHNEQDLVQAKSSLVHKGLITAKRDENFQPIGWKLTRHGAEIIDNVIVDSSKPVITEDKLDKLAQKLKDLFPKGKKPGTNNYWAEGKALIVRRLKLFFKKYGDDYPFEDIIEATRNYVQSFNGNYQWMKTLRYFILKEVKGASGEIEGTSDLLNYLENVGQENIDDRNWMDSVR